jgi:hypothetical protein
MRVFVDQFRKCNDWARFSVICLRGVRLNQSRISGSSDNVTAVSDFSQRVCMICACECDVRGEEYWKLPSGKAVRAGIAVWLAMKVS